MSAPSGSENPSGFPISPFSSDGLTVGTVQSEEGDWCAKKGLFCELLSRCLELGILSGSSDAAGWCFPSVSQISSMGWDPKPAA